MIPDFILEGDSVNIDPEVEKIRATCPRIQRKDRRWTYYRGIYVVVKGVDRNPWRVFV